MRYIGVTRAVLSCPLISAPCSATSTRTWLCIRKTSCGSSRGPTLSILPRYISGLVHRPGLYPLTEGLRVGDLVFRAGNVLKFAYLERAELTRHPLGQGERTPYG